MVFKRQTNIFNRPSMSRLKSNQGNDARSTNNRTSSYGTLNSANLLLLTKLLIKTKLLI